jgi:hypothetical protein
VKRPSLVAALLALLPFVAMCFTIPWWDRVQPLVLGLPFNFFWLLSWIVLSSACLRIAYHVEVRREASRARSSSEDQPG